VSDIWICWARGQIVNAVTETEIVNIRSNVRSHTRRWNVLIDLPDLFAFWVRGQDDPGLVIYYQKP